MVDRWSTYVFHGELEEEPCHHGKWVEYDDYSAMELRLTSIISEVQSEVEDERKLRLAAESRLAELEKDAARYRHWLFMSQSDAVEIASIGSGCEREDAIDECMSREA